MGTFTLLAPPIIGLIGAKVTIVISGLFYIAIIPFLTRPLVGTLFLGSILAGAGGGVIWTAQGAILFSNSDNKTLGRNTGIFWIFLQSSFIIGNLFYYLFVHINQQDTVEYNEETICITETVNAIIYGVLGAIGLFGVFLLIFIRTGSSKSKPELKPLLGGSEVGDKMVTNTSINTNSFSESDVEEKIAPSVLSSKVMVLKQTWRDFLRTFQLMCSLRMILLMICFMYSGFELTFWAGVIGTLAARTLQRAEYAGAIGMAVGVGEVVGGILLVTCSVVVRRIGRDPVILIGYFCHMIAFLLVFYTVPDDATAKLQPTAKVYLIDQEFAAIIALIAAGFLLGLGDGCYNTQIYSIVGEGYPGTDGAPAITIFQCVQSISAGVAFLYNGLGQIALKWELLILVVFGTSGTISFIFADWNLRKKGPTQRPN
jgi:hypothetical protein